MVDQLRKLVNDRDRAMARPHRLEPERLVLPARSGASSRYSCRDCWWIAPPMRPETCPECGGQLVEVTA